jgi:hypothetical protein
MGKVRGPKGKGLLCAPSLGVHITCTHQTWPERRVHTAGQKIIPIDVAEEGVSLRVESVPKHANSSPCLAPVVTLSLGPAPLWRPQTHLHLCGISWATPYPLDGIPLQKLQDQGRR